MHFLIKQRHGQHDRRLGISHGVNNISRLETAYVGHRCAFVDRCQEARSTLEGMVHRQNRKEVVAATEGNGLGTGNDIGHDVFMRGVNGKIRSIYNTKYSLTLYELIKSYSSIIMKKDFQRINIPKLPVLTTEGGIKIIKEFFGKLLDWKNINELIPVYLSKGKNLRRSGASGLLSGSLELVKEGDLIIKQNKLFDNIYIKEKK